MKNNHRSYSLHRPSLTLFPSRYSRASVGDFTWKIRSLGSTLFFMLVALATHCSEDAHPSMNADKRTSTGSISLACPKYYIILFVWAYNTVTLITIDVVYTILYSCMLPGLPGRLADGAGYLGRYLVCL